MTARHALIGSTAILAVVLAATGATAVEPPPGSEVSLHVGGDQTRGTDLTRLVNTGALPVSADVASVYGGDASVELDRFGDTAVRLPALASGWSAPRAVIRVRHQAQSGDPLSPGSRGFQFGAMFKKDERSAGTTTDNGDNLVQRGLASDPSQYKLEVDGGRLACRVKGDAGAVTVRSSVPIYWHRWYSAVCARSGSTVTVTVTEHLADTNRVTRSSASGSIGTLRWSKPKTPMSVGGKLAADGSIIRSATDQFNGIISDPFLDISS